MLTRADYTTATLWSGAAMSEYFTHVVVGLSAPDRDGDTKGLLLALRHVVHVAGMGEGRLLAVLDGRVHEEDLEPALRLVRSMPAVTGAVPGRCAPSVAPVRTRAADALRELVSGNEPKYLPDESGSDFARRCQVWVAMSDLVDRAEEESGLG